MVWSHICHNYSKNNVIPRWFYNEQENTLQAARSTKLTDSFALQTLCTVSSPQLAYTGGSTCPSPWQTRKAYLTSKFWRTEFRIPCVTGRFRLELATLTNAAVFNLRSRYRWRLILARGKLPLRRKCTVYKKSRSSAHGQAVHTLWFNDFQWVT